MTRTRTPLLTTVALAVAASSLLAPGVASAALAEGDTLTRSRIVAAGPDARGDVRSHNVPKAVARSLDLVQVRTRYGLGARTDLIEVSLVRRDTAATRLDRHYSAQLSWTADGKDRSARVVHQPRTGKTWLVRGGEKFPCSGVGAAISGRAVRLSVPRSCVGDATRYRVRAQATVSGAGGKGVDVTRWRRTEPLPLAALGSWTWREKTGDVTYNPDLDPAESAAGESADITSASVSVSGGVATVNVSVVDAAYWQWDPRQKYTLAFQAADGTEVVLFGEADRTGTGAAFILRGTKVPEGCEASAVTDQETTTITVPAVCTDGARVSTFQVTVAATSEAGVDEVEYGHDKTAVSGRVLIN